MLTRLKRMKPTAYLINTARGGIVDEAAAARRVGRPASSPARASTFSSRSPRRPDRRCSRLPNVIMAPHVAGVTRGSRGPDERADRPQHSERALDGDPVRQNVINQDVLG